MLSLYWLGMHGGTMEWIFISQNPLILVLLKNQWPLTKRDEKALACWSKLVYHDSVPIQLKGLGNSLIYTNTMFKAQTKTLLIEEPFLMEFSQSGMLLFPGWFWPSLHTRILPVAPGLHLGCTLTNLGSFRPCWCLSPPHRFTCNWYWGVSEMCFGLGDLWKLRCS